METAEPLPLSKDEVFDLRDRMAEAIAVEQGIIGGVKPEQVRMADAALRAVLHQLNKAVRRRA